MMMKRGRFTNAVPAMVAAGAMLVAGCIHRATEMASEPSTPIREVASPSGASTVAVGAADSPASAMPDTLEPRVDLDMVNAPVSLVLQRLAQIGGLQLIVPTNLNRTVSVAYVNVPVSEALKDVLSRSGLRLGPTPRPGLPFDTVTVFYQLPANVDSMSVTAIMYRFGISKGLAELLVRSRRP